MIRNQPLSTEVNFGVLEIFKEEIGSIPVKVMVSTRRSALARSINLN